MRDQLPKMISTPELRFECADERKFDVIEEIKGRLQGIDEFTISDIDGVRIETKKGWWLVRASNTEAALVSRCEAYNAEELDILKDQIKQQLIASNVELPGDIF